MSIVSCVCVCVCVLSDNDIGLFHIQLSIDRYWICEMCVCVCVCVCVCTLLVYFLETLKCMVGMCDQAIHICE